MKLFFFFFHVHHHHHDVVSNYFPKVNFNFVMENNTYIHFIYFSVRDRQRTKLERDILADVNHPFIVKLHYGITAFIF